MISPIGISGKYRSGKDTAAAFVSKYFIEKNIKTRRVAFADAVKEVAEIISEEKMSPVDIVNYSYPVYDFTIEQKNKFLPRWNMTLGEMLQKIGTDALRDNFDKYVWIKTAFQRISEMDHAYIISDVRFLNEVEAIKQTGGLIIRIEGDPLNVRKDTKRNINHESETELDNYKGFDIVIKNDKTLVDLRNNIFDFLDTVIG